MKRGFTLIEILLALLVVSVGIVTVTGLLSSTLSTNSKARDDLNVVSFAEMVLNYCHAISDWNSIPTSGTLSLIDYDETPLALQLGGVQQFTSFSTLSDGSTLERYSVTYQLSITQNGNVKTLLLTVWPGFGTSEQPRYFQTEIYNWNPEA